MRATLVSRQARSPGIRRRRTPFERLRRREHLLSLRGAQSPFVVLARGRRRRRASILLRGMPRDRAGDRAAGLDAFYRQRESADAEPSSAKATKRSRSAPTAPKPAVSSCISTRDLREASLLLEGIHCGACVWLVENYLGRQPGVAQASVNLATHRAACAGTRGMRRCQDCFARLRRSAIAHIPTIPSVAKRRRAPSGVRCSHAARVAVLAMMQVMMFSLPGYTSADGVEPEYRAAARLGESRCSRFRWCSIARRRSSPAHGATSGCGSSGWTCRSRSASAARSPRARGRPLGGGGAVYYDSVTMFVALLLVARLAELRARRRAGDAIEAIAHDLPEAAERLLDYRRRDEGGTSRRASLEPGDRIRVAAGAPDCRGWDGSSKDARTSKRRC